MRARRPHASAPSPQCQSEELRVGMAVVPEGQHDLSDDAAALDRAPGPAVAGDLPVVAHDVELSRRDAEGGCSGGTGYRRSERVTGREVRPGEPPAVDVDAVAGRVDG